MSTGRDAGPRVAGEAADAPARHYETRASRPGTRRDVRAALALAGPVLFTPPALAIADREATLLGVPALVVYVLGAWLLGIVLTFLAARGEGRGRR